MRALILTAKPSTLLEKILFEVVGFDQEQVTFVDPARPLSVRDKPDVIIPMGQEGIEKLHIAGSITQAAGKTFEYLDIPVVPIFASGFIEKNEHLVRRWAEDMYTAYAIMSGIAKLDQTNQMVVVTDALQLMDLIENVKRAGYCSFDFETTSLTDLKHHDPNFYCTTLSITFQQGSSYVIPLYHKDSPNTKEFIETCRVQLQKDVFLNPDITKVGQNVKFDMHCLSWWGIPLVLGPIHDTMVMHHLLDEHARHGLKGIVAQYQPRYTDYDKALGEFTDYANIPIDVLCVYNAMDTDLTFRQYWIFTELLLEDERLYILFRNLVAASTPALFAMEQRGMLINKEYLLESIDKVKVMITEVQGEMMKVPEVQGYQEARTDKALIAYITTLTDKIAARKDRLVAAKAKKIEALRDRVVKAQEKRGSFKSEKAEDNNDARIDSMLAEITELVNKEPTDETLEKWEDIVDSWEGYTIKPEEHLKPEDLTINLASPNQMTELLFGRHGFKFEIPMDPYGRPLNNSAKETLEMLKDKTGFLDNLMALRQLKKILSTYLVSLLARMDSNHRIHATFKQAGTKTGRLSSADPNLQNIIKRTKYKKVEDAVAMVMKCFVPPKGMKIGQADYSQAELRGIAFYAKDKAMLEAYANGEDLHAVTAATTMGLTLDQFKALPDKDRKRYRYEAKSTNFGFIYGMSAEGFKEYARNNYGVTVSLKQAKDRRAKFFKKFSSLLDYHKTYIAKAKKFGYVRTLFGQRLRLPDIYSSEAGKQSHAERNAINGPIQGTAGQMMIFAIALLYHRAPRLQIVNTVHDSLINYSNNPSMDNPIIKETMENLPIMEYFDRDIDTVEMAVDFELSDSSWGELKEV